MTLREDEPEIGHMRISQAGEPSPMTRGILRAELKNRVVRAPNLSSGAVPRGDFRSQHLPMDPAIPALRATPFIPIMDADWICQLHRLSPSSTASCSVRFYVETCIVEISIVASMLQTRV
jgi:hypothetical protein